MPKTFTPAAEEVHVISLGLTRNHHAHLLHPRKVAVDLIMVFPELNEAGDPTGPALKLHGVACAGIAKIIGPKDRAMGRGDCEIQIDADFWKQASPEEREALLDHELMHFSLKRDKYGTALMDDYRRPLLKMRQHDYDHGFFTEIARRHGDNSLEVQHMNKLVNQAGRIYMPGQGVGGDEQPFLNFGQRQDADTQLPAEHAAEMEVDIVNGGYKK